MKDIAAFAEPQAVPRAPSRHPPCRCALRRYLRQAPGQALSRRQAEEPLCRGRAVAAIPFPAGCQRRQFRSGRPRLQRRRSRYDALSGAGQPRRRALGQRAPGPGLIVGERGGRARRFPRRSAPDPGRRRRASGGAGPEAGHGGGAGILSLRARARRRRPPARCSAAPFGGGRTTTSTNSIEELEAIGGVPGGGRELLPAAADPGLGRHLGDGGQPVRDQSASCGSAAGRRRSCLAAAPGHPGGGQAPRHARELHGQALSRCGGQRHACPCQPRRRSRQEYVRRRQPRRQRRCCARPSAGCIRRCRSPRPSSPPASMPSAASGRGSSCP